MKSADKKTTLPVILVFLFVIFAVPITQAVVELCKGGRIQALDLIVDATVTPFRNANRMHELALRAPAYVDSIGDALKAAAVAASPEAASAERTNLLVDDALANIEELKKVAVARNRHVHGDSTLPSFKKLNEISLRLAGLGQALRGGEARVYHANALAPIASLCDSLPADYPVRSFANLPVLAIANFRYILWNDRYLRPYEKELENSSVFAVAVRPRMQFIRYCLFRDLGEKGVLGRKGWFFYKPDVDFLVKPYVLDPRSMIVDPNDHPLSDNPVAVITKFRDQLKAAGIDLLMVIIPTKPSIYPDVLSPGIGPSKAATISHSLRMMNDLRAAGVDVVDLFGPFARERGNDATAGDSLYLHEDTHWKARGVRLAARIIAERIKRYPWYSPGTADFSVDSAAVERVGDVGIMTTLEPEKVRGRFGLFMPEKTTCFQVFRTMRDSSGAVIDRTLYKDDFHDSPILLLGDSFSRIYQTDEPRGAGLIAHIALDLSQPIASLVNDGGASTLVRRSLARNPRLLRGRKLVVWEVVERDFRFGEEGWKDVPIDLTLKEN